MFGERLRSERKRLKMSQQELANKLNLHYKSISAYERDISEPDDKTKVFFARFFNVSLDYLMGLTDERLSLKRTDNFALPDGFPEKYKKDLSMIAELMIIKDRDYDKSK